jgi:hypothetical protein
LARASVNAAAASFFARSVVIGAPYDAIDSPHVQVEKWKWKSDRHTTNVDVLSRLYNFGTSHFHFSTFPLFHFLLSGPLFAVPVQGLAVSPALATKTVCRVAVRETRNVVSAALVARFR